MFNPIENYEQRKDPRVSLEFPVRISVGSQITVQGHLKDLSLNSAFIKIKNNIFLKTGDEVGFAILSSPNDTDALMQGSAHISRFVPGEGFAIYFSKMDDASQKYLKKLLPKTGI
ncbi:MAG: PilZ domain-containing protein [Candidatus Omnitrophica bacterium]|nr:PilZ domain-containing protein [Candidatus Omnitrophota bacterium]